MRIVKDVQYRHVGAYVKVLGRSKDEAERNSKQVGTALLNRLPPTSEVKPGRYKGLESAWHCYEVPIVLTNGPQEVRKCLAELALKGRS